jgi:hypothetical protein
MIELERPDCVAWHSYNKISCKSIYRSCSVPQERSRLPTRLTARNSEYRRSPSAAGAVGGCCTDDSRRQRASLTEVLRGCCERLARNNKGTDPRVFFVERSIAAFRLRSADWGINAMDGALRRWFAGRGRAIDKSRSAAPFHRALPYANGECPPQQYLATACFGTFHWQKSVGVGRT